MSRSPGRSIMGGPKPWVGYAVAVAATAVAALARSAYDQRFGPEPAFLIPFLVPVALAGWFAGLWCGLFTTALNTLLIAYTFTEPDTSLSIANANDIVRVIVFVTAAVSISLITHQLHRHRRRAEGHAREARDRQAELEREVARRQDAERLLEVRVAERTAEVEGQRRLLDAILDALPAAVVIADPTGRVTRMNPACERVWGAAAPMSGGIAEYGEWVGYWPGSGRRIEPHEWAMSRALLRGEACPGEWIEFERFGDRSRRSIWHTGAPVYGPTGAVVAGVVASVDLTAQVAAEQALRQSEERFRAFMDHAPFAAWIVDADSRAVYTNAGFDRHLGLPAGSYLGKTPADVWPAVAREYTENDRRVLAGGAAVEAEEPFVGPDGSPGVARVVKFPVTGPGGEPLVGGIAIDVTAQRQAEAAVRESERFTREVLDALPAQIAVVDRAGTITTVNRAWERAAGEHPDAAPPAARRGVGVSYLAACEGSAALGCAEAAEAAAAIRRAVAGGGPCDGLEYDCHDPTGRRWFSMTVTPLAGPSSGAVVCHTDITARRLAEEGAREGHEKFRLAFEHAPIGVSLTGTDGRWLQVNRSLCDFTGYSEAELLASNFQAITHPDDLGQDLDHLRRFLAGTVEAYQTDKRYVHKDGHLIHVHLSVAMVRDDHGSPRYFVCHIADITARKATEAALRESEDRFRTAFDHAPIGMALIAPDGHWQQVNRRLCEIVGYTEAELLATDFRAVTHPDDLDADLDLRRQVLAGAVPHYQLEKRYLHKGGHPVEVLVAVSLVRDGAGRPRYFITQVEDISERRTAQRALSANEALLRQFIRHSPAAIAMFDREVRYLQVSDRWVTDYGLAGRPLIGESHYDVFADLPDRWRAVHRRVLAGAVEACDDDPFERADGSTEWLQWECRPWHAAAGQVGGLIMFTQVVTARKRAEMDLRASEERFRVLFEHSSDAHLIFSEADGILDCNPAAVAMLRCPNKTALLRLHPAELSPEYQPDGRRSLDKCVEMDATARRNGYHRFDWDHRRADGEVFPCEVTLTPVALGGRSALLVVWHELTERKRAEQALRDSEERFRAAMEGSLDAVFFLAAERAGGAITDFRFTELNGRGAALVARPRERVLGQRLCELLPVNRTGGFFDRYVRVVETGEPLVEEFALDPASGLAATRLRHQVVKVGDGVAVTTQDITARKRAEEQVLASLREKEVLLKEIHHRVKNNLQIISSLLYLQSAGLPDRAVRGLFEESRGRVKSMALVHERLYRSGDLAGVDLAEYARQLAADLFRAYRVSHDGVRLDLDVTAPPLPIDVAIPCGLLLNEMLSNCLKHAFQGRTAGVVGVAFRRAGGDVVLSVSDDGPGFPPGFDFRTSPSFGLQLIRTLAEQLNGHAALSGGPGATVAVTFPAPKEMPR